MVTFYRGVAWRVLALAQLHNAYLLVRLIPEVGGVPLVIKVEQLSKFQPGNPLSVEGLDRYDRLVRLTGQCPANDHQPTRLELKTA